MKIGCIACGNDFPLDAEYQDHRGVAKCPCCRSLLQIHVVRGSVKSVMPFMLAPSTTVIGGVSGPEVDESAPWRDAA
jgi:NAD-dependent SIR2 family protein deacetylase